MQCWSMCRSYDFIESFGFCIIFLNYRLIVPGLYITLKFNISDKINLSYPNSKFIKNSIKLVEYRL